MTGLSFCGAVDREAKISNFPCFASPEDIGRLDISMEHSHPQQILNRLHDFASDGNSLLLAQLAVIGHILQQIPMRTVLSNEVTMRDSPVYIFEAYDVGVGDFLEDLYLIIQHFETRR